ncbi:MAG: cytochrome c3 family protein [Desulfobacteraceae bacterium]|nr:cytochrome c3 family protein [Desulfobacteraceae bacterium]
MKLLAIGILSLVTLTICLFFSVGLYAETKAKAPADIKMEAPYKHKKAIATLSHQKHTTDYKIGCGECHHDDKGKPLTNLKEGDAVQSCFECHKKPGEIKGKKAKGLSKTEKREYHANAVHDNCVGCHKKWNKKNNSKAAPQKCTECHPKEKK